MTLSFTSQLLWSLLGNTSFLSYRNQGGLGISVENGFFGPVKNFENICFHTCKKIFMSGSRNSMRRKWRIFNYTIKNDPGIDPKALTGPSVAQEPKKAQNGPKYAHPVECVVIQQTFHLPCSGWNLRKIFLYSFCVCVICLFGSFWHRTCITDYKVSLSPFSINLLCIMLINLRSCTI